MVMPGVPGIPSQGNAAGMADAAHAAEARGRSYSAENMAEYKLTHPSRWARLLRRLRRSSKQD